MQSEKEIHALAQRILVKAAIKLGGSGALSKHLGIDEATLGHWLAGRSVPPAETVLKAIAPLVDEAATLLRDPAISRPRTSQ